MPSSLYFLWSPIKGSRESYEHSIDVCRCRLPARSNMRTKANRSKTVWKQDGEEEREWKWDYQWVDQCSCHGLGCYEWVWIVETLVNHEFMNKCDCICIRIQVLGSILLSLTAPLYIGKYTAQTKHKKRSAEYYSMLSSVFQLFREKASVYWG